MTQTATRPKAFVHAATCEEHVSDQDILRDLIDRHVVGDPNILDMTWGNGGIWKGLPWYPQERVDSRPLDAVTCVADFRQLPVLWTGRFDLVVFDPPFVSEMTRKSRYNTRFGTSEASVQHAPNVSHLFAPALVEAHRVLKKRGVLLVKVMDCVHRGKMHYQVADLIMAVRAQTGLRECDRRLKVEERASNMDNFQGEVRHSRTDYVYWIVVKKGGRC